MDLDKMDLDEVDLELDHTQLRVYLGTIMSVLEIIKLNEEMTMEELIVILLHNSKEALKQLKGTNDGTLKRH